MKPKAGYDFLMRFDNEIAIVTGASSGIGEATSRLLASEGARVAVFARRREKLQAIASQYPGRILVVEGDVTIESDVRDLFARCLNELGPVSILVNNAGTVEPGSLEETSIDTWDYTFEVNVRSAFLTCRKALPVMRETGRGVIVNVSSISGTSGPEKFPGFVAYAASKAALIMLTEALAGELKETAIRVNCISPGSVDTAMLQKAAPGARANITSEQIAEMIAFLASAASQPMNGQNLRAW